ncbi:MAG: gas vesicle protein GvpG [Spirochaetia bacterium]|nr:gas vesicle protein GvpG [Spirochaetia bacterium]
MTIVLSLLLVICVLALFVPLLSRKAVPEFYISGTPDEEHARAKQKIKSMLADLRQEFDSGKIAEEEFSSMAGDLLAELDRLEKVVLKAAVHKPGKRVFCPACGALQPEQSKLCAQCGSELAGAL